VGAPTKELLMSGKGSKPRPFSVDSDTYSNNWNAIFGKKKDNTGTDKNEYYDVLSTEESLTENEKDKTE